ncbi:MAG TPA: hypothetical protein VF142_15635 [Longimicrobium sp.]
MDAVAWKGTAGTPGSAARAVCAPTRVPSVHCARAIPAASVPLRAGCTCPPPVSSAHSTSAPGTGFPYASVTRTASESGSGAATCPSPPPATATIRAGPAACTSAVKTSVPSSTVAVACTRPGAVPRRQDVEAAPAESVRETAGITVPASGGTLQDTCAPTTGRPSGMRSTTAIESASTVPAGPRCPSPPRLASCRGAPRVTAWATSVAGAKPGTRASTVCAESTRGPRIHRARAVPSARVRARDGATVPPPAATSHPTSIPSTGLPKRSFTATASESARAVPTGPTAPPPDRTSAAGVPDTARARRRREGTPSARASTTWLSAATVPSVHRVRAKPRPSDVTAWGAACPPPATTANRRGMPGRGRPAASTAVTTSSSGSAAPAAACCPSPFSTRSSRGTAPDGGAEGERSSQARSERISATGAMRRVREESVDMIVTSRSGGPRTRPGPHATRFRCGRCRGWPAGEAGQVPAAPWGLGLRAAGPR